MACTSVCADDMRTCMHLAASSGEMHIVEHLIEHGANTNAVDRWGGTPLSDAVREGHAAIARRLVQDGAMLSYDEARASSELCEYAKTGDVQQINLLLECGADGNAADYVSRSGSACHCFAPGVASCMRSQPAIVLRLA